MSYFYKNIASPVGELILISTNSHLSAVLWGENDIKRVVAKPEIHNAEQPILKQAEQELHDYFEGQRKEFTLPLNPIGTSFQLTAWKALMTIPFSKTVSYGDIARQIGKPTASRAVGAAIGKNPISIIIPCHRVIGSSGRLTGFAGGLDTKSWLLNFEKQAKG